MKHNSDIFSIAYILLSIREKCAHPLPSKLTFNLPNYPGWEGGTPPTLLHATYIIELVRNKMFYSNRCEILSSSTSITTSSWNTVLGTLRNLEPKNNFTSSSDSSASVVLKFLVLVLSSPSSLR